MSRSMFSQRSQVTEMMDQTELDPIAIKQNFDDLVFINKWLGGSIQSIRAIEALSEKTQVNSICDVGFGAGDFMDHLVRSGYKEKLIGIDPMEEAHVYVRDNFKSLVNARLLKIDALTWLQEPEQVDVVHASLFCHHLDHESLVVFLALATKKARVGVVINDLHRALPAYYSIKWLTAAFATSHYTKNDAPLSVLRGFTRNEWERLLSESGIKRFQIQWKWAFRHVITIPSQ